MTDEQMQKLSLVGQIYTPAYPVELQELFSGRAKELRAMLEIVGQKGRQVLLYGDRGVGKTSFANIVKILLDSNGRQIVRASCSTEDTFESLFYNVFSKLSISYGRAKQKIGFGAEIEKTQETIIFSNLFPKEKIDINAVQTVLGMVANPIIIIDEFDRLESNFF